MTDCQLYLISPLDVTGDFPQRLERALDAGSGLVTAFQFRVKDIDQHEAARLAEPLQAICATRDVAFIVNDDVALAKRLGYRFLDTGAMYRAVALAAMRRGLDGGRAEEIVALAGSIEVIVEEDRVLLDGDDVTDAIRSEDCAAMASRVAAIPAVREALLARQRAYRRSPGLVAEGRDMGSVIFPDAGRKFFLTASVEARAQRRYKQLMEKGLPANIDSLSRELSERDARDAARSVAPLKQLPDAVLVETSAMTVDEAVRFVTERIA